jgi:aminopeptidase N
MYVGAMRTLFSARATTSLLRRRLAIIAATSAIGLTAPFAISAQATRAVRAPTATSAAIAPDSLFPYQPGIDVAHYDFGITLPGRGREFQGSAALTVNRRRTVDTLRLDLKSAMVVDSVLIGTRARAFRRDAERVHIPLQAADGSRLLVTVRWHGVPDDGLIVTERDSTAEAERGWRVFGDNWPNRARHWLPTVDHPSDKATVRWTVVAPSDLSVVANGVQTSQASLSSRQGFSAWQFTMRQPIPTYLMVIGAARMKETPLGRTACGSGIDGGCVPQSVWTFPQEANYVPGPFSEAGRVIEMFAKTATGFPYEHLSHLQSSTRFGGMENATAIFYSDNAFRRHNVGIGLIAHETAHQWFGNAVSPRRWEDVWLSEGFATYWAALYIRDSRGDTAYLGELRRMRSSVLRASVVTTRPVVDTVGAATPMTLLNANSYQKGGFVLRMLHGMLGDSVFFAGVREYQRRFRHGTATTGELQRIMERHARRSLDTFFTLWLHRPGFAEITVAWRYDATARMLETTVTQGSRFAPYALPLVLALRDANGATQRITLAVQATTTQTLRTPIGMIGTPIAVDADPDAAVLGDIRVEPRTP